MCRNIDWDRQEDGSYAWPLGLHYYAEDHEGEWIPCLMIGNDDVKNWPPVKAREEAEEIMQADLDRQVAYWSGRDIPLPLWAGGDWDDGKGE